MSINQGCNLGMADNFQMAKSYDGSHHGKLLTRKINPDSNREKDKCTVDSVGRLLSLTVVNH